MPDEFLTYRIFPDKETAADFAQVLQQKDIVYRIDEDRIMFDPSYANNAFNKDYRLKIRQTDFAFVDKVLEDYYKTLVDKVGGDYYLFSFADSELEDILAKPDEWGHLDYVLAGELLKRRGKEVSPAKARSLREKRLLELSAPGTVKGGSIAIAYVAGILLFPVGLFIGWHWYNEKKILPNGERVPLFEERVRRHGLRLFLAALVITIFVIGSRMLKTLR